MARRTINFTDRIPLMSDIHAKIEVDKKPEDEFNSFSCDLQLCDLGLPDEANVVVDAYRGNSRMRFDYGTVGAISPPNDTQLKDIEGDNLAKFSVKVIHDNRILAKSGGINPNIGEDLLILTKAELPPGLVWRLDLEGSAPVLQVNNQCPDAMLSFKTPLIQSIILPSVFRLVLDHLIPDYEKDGSPDDWQHKWVNIAEGLTKYDIPEKNDDNPSDRLAWVDDCVNSFAREYNFVDLFNKSSSHLGGFNDNDD